MRLPQLDTVGGGREATGPVYAALLRSGLEQMDAEPICGWVIDLRGNGGGNMWPMLQGLDPLLGDSPFGDFLLPGGATMPWIRANGGLFPSAETFPAFPPGFALAHAAAPVAILIGPATASSGEMVAIALIGRPGVRTFGRPSAGFTTANQVVPLPDGAHLMITTAKARDRTGRTYDGAIVPDEPVPAEQAEAAATRWLAGHCA